MLSKHINFDLDRTDASGVDAGCCRLSHCTPDVAQYPMVSIELNFNVMELPAMIRIALGKVGARFNFF